LLLILLLILLSLLLSHIILCSCCAPRRVAAVSVPPTYSTPHFRICVSSPRLTPRHFPPRATPRNVFGLSIGQRAALPRLSRPDRGFTVRNGRENDGTRGSRGSRAALTMQARMVRETRPTSDTRKTGRRLSASASDTARAVRHRLGSTRVRNNSSCTRIHTYSLPHRCERHVLVQPRRLVGGPGAYVTRDRLSHRARQVTRSNELVTHECTIGGSA